MSFGAAFGKLVKRRRGVEGLTQQALAVAAFGDESYKTRISELENGKVSKPQTKTIDALILALNISDDELMPLLNETPHPLYVDSITDFFATSATQHLNAGVVIREDGSAAFMFDRPLNRDLKRLEYFREEQTMVLVTMNEKRRPFGVPLHETVGKHLVNMKQIELSKVELDADGTVVSEESHGIFPLKVID